MQQYHYLFVISFIAGLALLSAGCDKSTHHNDSTDTDSDAFFAAATESATESAYSDSESNYASTDFASDSSTGTPETDSQTNEYDSSEETDDNALDNALNDAVVDDSEFPENPSFNLDGTVATTMNDASRFLYTGDNPVQKDLDDSILDPSRISIVRGKITDKNNNPLGGVTVRIYQHPEFGYTLSRSNGEFDLVINGGQRNTVSYEMRGYLSSQRTRHVPRGEYSWMPDVVLIPKDRKATTVSVNSNEYQIVQGTSTSDEWGKRTSTVLLPQGTTATAILADGSEQALSSLTIRSTEYTVGANGPQTMPATIPSPVGYTYAIELSIDEADAIGATDVRFNQPVAYYVQNFLGFPAGTVVPLGYYDPKRAEWIPGESGVVIDLVDEPGEPIGIDADGDGDPDADYELEEFGITDAEREKLATLYSPGQSLWRVMIPHFSTWDCNWPFSPPEDAESPLLALSSWLAKDSFCAIPGSIIFPDTQVLGESIPITGTDYQLHYFSNRGTRRLTDFSVEIPLTGDTLPAGLKAVELELYVAGKRFEQRFEAMPNLSHAFTWDGLDVYGRKVQGKTVVTVKAGYVYDGVYNTTTRFGLPGNAVITGSRTREEVTLWNESQTELGAWDTTATGLGGFGLNVHHTYNPATKRLLLGDGRQRSAESVSQVLVDISNPDGEITYPDDIAVAPDGRVYVAVSFHNQVFEIGIDGTERAIAGTGDYGNSGDGGPAIDATLNAPECLYLKKDGTLLVCTQDRIRAIDSNGTISTLAGGGTQYGLLINVPATDVYMAEVSGIAEAADGSQFVTEWFAGVLSRIDSSGNLTTILGGGRNTPLAQEIDNQWIFPRTILSVSDGNLYFGTATGKIYRISTSGKLILEVDVEKIRETELPYDPTYVDLAIDSDGAFLLADTNNNLVVKWNGTTLSTLIESRGVNKSQMWGLRGIAFDQNGSLLIASQGGIYRLMSPMSEVFKDKIVLPSLDGTEMFVFDTAGRHLETRDALTQTVLRSFEYDGSGWLTAVVERGGLKTVFNRNNSGELTKVISSSGLTTDFTLNSRGRIASAVDALGRQVSFEYNSDGLLIGHTDTAGGAHTYTYDSTGLLLSDSGPTGFFQTLSRTIDAGQNAVTVSTPMGRTFTRSVGTDENGDTVSLRTNAAGQVTQIADDGLTRTAEYPDGTVITQKEIPDIRWQTMVPFVTEYNIETPGEREMKVTATQTDETPTGKNNITEGKWRETVTVAHTTVASTVDVVSKTVRTEINDTTRQILNYSEQGQPEKLTRPGFPEVTYVYDDNRRLASTVLSSSDGKREARFSYDANGYVNGITNALGNTVQLVNDDGGRPLQIVNGNGDTAILAHNDLNLIESVTPPGRNAHHHDFDGAGMLTGYAPPPLNNAPTQTSYAYDNDLQLTQTVLPSGRSVLQGYDAAGRISDVTVEAGAWQFTYLNDANRLKQIETPDGNIVAFEWDGPLQTSASWQGEVTGAIAFDYDWAFRVDSIETEGGEDIRIHYNDNGLLEYAGPTELEYDDVSTLPVLVATDGIETDVYYNGFAEVIEQSTSVYDAPLFNRVYQRDKLGRITAVTETIETDTREIAYTYDNAGRLVEVSESVNGQSPQKRSYTYDANGNRLSVSSSKGTITASYDGQDRVVQYDTLQFEHGPDGELQSIVNTETGDATAYSYDAMGQLIRVTLPNGDIIDYVYDLPGRRIAKRVNGNQTDAYLYYDQLRPAARVDPSGTVLQQYVYATGINVPDAIITDDDTFAVIRDHIGSVRLVVNGRSGDVVQRLDYDEFGAVTRDTNPGFQPFGFAGGIYDPDIKFVHFNARDYNPVTGRWTTKDPILFGGGDTNLYGYVFVDPVNLLDPNGMLVAQIAIGAVVGAVTGFTSYTVFNPNGTGNAAGLAEAIVGGTVAGVFTAVAGPAFVAAGSGFASYAAFGALASGVGYSAGSWVNGLNSFSIEGLAATMTVGALTGGMSKYMVGMGGRNDLVETVIGSFFAAIVEGIGSQIQNPCMQQKGN